MRISDQQIANSASERLLCLLPKLAAESIVPPVAGAKTESLSQEIPG